MDEANYLAQGLFLFLLIIFTHWAGYKKNLFSLLKITYQNLLYPVWGGILTLITILCYMFSVPLIPWYAPFIVLLMYFALGHKEQFLSLLKDQKTLPKTSLLWDVLIGFTLFIVSLPLLSFVGNALEIILSYYFQMEVPRQYIVDMISQIRDNIPLLLFIFLLICVLVPAFEEFLYRANIQTWLKNTFSPFWAIFLTSVFFASCHFFTIDTVAGKIIVLASTFISSMYLGFAYERQRSLVASITYHSLMNTLTFVQVLFIG